MDDNTKAITAAAQNVRRLRRAEQKAFRALSLGTAKTAHSSELAELHEQAMNATYFAERDLATLVINLLVRKGA